MILNFLFVQQIIVNFQKEKFINFFFFFTIYFNILNNNVLKLMNIHYSTNVNALRVRDSVSSEVFVDELTKAGGGIFF